MTDPEIRPIACDGFNPVPMPDSFGPAPQLQWIAIDKLVVDDSYQRPLTSQSSRSSVRTIAAGFDWRRFAPVIVSPVPGGRYAIVDGQHRTTAALLVGIVDVPCNVILADRREQARAFEAINGQVTQIKPVQIFKARLAHGDPEALRIAAVAKAAGVRILTFKASSLTRKPEDTMALNAITRLIKLHGDATVTLSLRAIRHNSGDLVGYLTGPIITAVTTVLADHQEWRDAPDLFESLEGIDLEEAWRDACQRASTRRGTTSQDQLQALLITHLDQTLKVAA